MYWWLFLNEDGTGLIQIVEGKSKAARRRLPVTPRVYSLLKARWETAGKPSQGWIFPTEASSATSTKTLRKIGTKRLEYSQVESSVPYVLRHTVLTKLGEAALGDVFVRRTRSAESPPLPRWAKKMGTIGNASRKKRPTKNKRIALKST